MSRRAKRTFTPKRATAPERTISAKDIRDALTGLTPPSSRGERSAIRVDLHVPALLPARPGQSHHFTGHISVDGFEAMIEVPVVLHYDRSLP